MDKGHTDGAEVAAADADREATPLEALAMTELAEATAEEPPTTMAEEAEVKEAPAPVAEADPDAPLCELAL